MEGEGRGVRLNHHMGGGVEAEVRTAVRSPTRVVGSAGSATIAAHR
jgi:hypothetical protein